MLVLIVMVCLSVKEVVLCVMGSAPPPVSLFLHVRHVNGSSSFSLFCFYFILFLIIYFCMYVFLFFWAVFAFGELHKSCLPKVCCLVMW